MLVWEGVWGVCVVCLCVNVNRGFTRMEGGRKRKAWKNQDASSRGLSPFCFVWSSASCSTTTTTPHTPRTHPYCRLAKARHAPVCLVLCASSRITTSSRFVAYSKRTPTSSLPPSLHTDTTPTARHTCISRCPWKGISPGTSPSCRSSRSNRSNTIPTTLPNTELPNTSSTRSRRSSSNNPTNNCTQA